MHKNYLLCLLIILNSLLQPFVYSQSPSVWRNHGKDHYNTRNQQSNLIDKSSYNLLTLTRTYSWENTTYFTNPQGPVSCTPSIYGNTLYYTDHDGNLLAYDKLDGSAVFWQYIPGLLFSPARDAFSRSTPSLDGAYVYIGTSDGQPSSTQIFPGPNVIRLDKDTGLNSISAQLTPSSSQIITMSGTSFDSTYFVGLSSQQSLYALTVDLFQCCSDVGKFFKLDSDLNILWSFDTISIDLPIGPNGYSGASVWGSSPVIVETEEIVYITTGQNHNLPQYVKDCLLANPNDSMVCWEEGNYADSIIALNYTTGELLWHYTTRVDAWNAACLDPQSPNYYNCPQPTGPDGDFGMDVIFIESKYEECQEICECAREIIHDSNVLSNNLSDNILSGVDKILGMLGDLFTFSSNIDEKVTQRPSVNIFTNQLNLNSDNSNSNSDSTSNLNRKSNVNSNSKETIKRYTNGKVTEFDLLFNKESIQPINYKNCNYLPCYRADYDCTTCYPFIDAKNYTVISTRGLYSFDSIITGDIALTPSSNLYGVPPTIVNGQIDINNALAISAHQDMQNAYDTITQCVCDFSIDGDYDMNGASLVPGVYCISGNGWLNTTLILPSVNPGGLEYTFILQGNLTFYPGASIIIRDENTPCNINWVADRIIGESSTMLYGNFFSRDDIVLYGSMLFGKVYTLDGPIITYESEINPCECRYIPVSPTPSPSPSNSPSSTRSASASSSSTSTLTMSSTPSSSLSPSPSTLPSSSPSPTIPVSCLFCPRLADETLYYGILAGTEVNNTLISVISGNVGSSVPLIGFPPGIVTGSIHINDMSYITARNDIQEAYNSYVNCNSCDGFLNSADVTDVTLAPGIYCFDRLTLGGTITLDFLNDPSSLFIIIANEISIDSGTIMVDINKPNTDEICKVTVISKSNIFINSPTTLIGTMISNNDIIYYPTIVDPILPINILDGHLYALNGKVETFSLDLDICSCIQYIPPSMSMTPTSSMSVTPSPSVSPINPCRECYQDRSYESYALSGTSVANSGNSVITGDISVYNGGGFDFTGFPPGIYYGNLQQGNAQTVMMRATIQSMFGLYTECECDVTIDSGLYSGDVTFTPGTWCYLNDLTFSRDARITIDMTSNPNGIVIFKSRGRINFASNTTMNIIGTSQSFCNVFWLAMDDFPADAGIISINELSNLFGTFIAQSQIRVSTTISNPQATYIRGHLFTINGPITVRNLQMTTCSCHRGTPTITPSITPTQTCTCTPTPTITPQKRCECECDIYGNTHVPRYSMVVAADKSGTAYGLHAITGEELWKTIIGPGGYLGGSSWGGASDGMNYVYYNIINNEEKEWRLTPSNEITTSGGWVKVDIRTGSIVWSIRVPDDPMNQVDKLWATGPPTLVNDVLVTTSVNGRLYIIDTENGNILWNQHIANTIYGGASADNTNCIYVGSGYRFDGLLEDNRVFQFCIGDPISYSVDVEPLMG